MTVLLSRIMVDNRSRNALFADAGTHHRILLDSLRASLGAEQESPRAAARLLFREEEARQGRTLLVQSRYPLNPAALGSGYTLEATRDITSLLDKLAPGDLLRYRIVAAPVKRLGRTDQVRDLYTDRGERVSSREVTRPLRGAEADAWWEAQAFQAGLKLESAIATPQREAVDRHKRKQMRLPAVQFDGTAHISDEKALAAALIGGIGRGKNFGLGLLSLARAE